MFTTLRAQIISLAGVCLALLTGVLVTLASLGMGEHLPLLGILAFVVLMTAVAVDTALTALTDLATLHTCATDPHALLARLNTTP
ncbi:hypothetical protein IFR09_21075 [Pseudomonas syringae]|nr:hypothetical protein [Pseudomonas syringae]MBD8573728.1 hypothetical protein [Pseudomonas syringae]MBD8792577.1 hypothetical protein [Pseudomonas syringae]MBD8803013.1 hypothetical protein [Pseudomonas syringae]MBD8813657.1 hypothetical protein [Pseudomonas syringae]